MTPPIFPREQVAERLAVAPRLLLRYEARGLVRAVREGNVEGYDAAGLRRLWTVVSLQRDLGINLAGVEAILRLRAHMAEMHGRLEAFAERLRQIAEEELEPDEEGQP